MSGTKRSIEHEGLSTSQAKKARARGNDISFSHGVDLSSLRPEALDAHVEGVDIKERKIAEAYAFFPRMHDEIFTVQYQYRVAMEKRQKELSELREKYNGMAPHYKRARKVCQFFLDALKRPEIAANPNLKDAISHRIAYWFAVMLINQDLPSVRVRARENLGVQNFDAWYTEILEGAVRHLDVNQGSVVSDSASPSQQVPAPTLSVVTGVNSDQPSQPSSRDVVKRADSHDKLGMATKLCKANQTRYF